MLLSIHHRSIYRYSSPVFLEPFTVRLRPRCDATQTLRSYRIDVTPQPGGITHCIGLDGNNLETVWFDGLHEQLIIDVNTLVETHHGNPFDFLITEPDALTLPLKYDPHTALILANYLARNHEDALVTQFCREVLVTANHETIPFLTMLAEAIYSRFEYMFREHGDAWTAAQTMKLGQGSCRDFAVLFIDVCRSVGIAARFVSGYCIGDVIAESDMHAWAEVYLPGAGWRGFDPSRGLLTCDDYISVAAGQSPEDAAPTFGKFRGDALSTLTAEISISHVEKDPAIV